MNKAEVIREYFAAIGKKGGKKGGKARTAAMTPEERTELARKAVSTRWAKQKATKKGATKC